MDRRWWVDTHIHVSDYGPAGEKREHLLEDVLAVLEASDADLCFVISPDGAEMSRLAREPEGVSGAAEFIHDLVQRAPERLYGSCMVNPNFLDESLKTMDLCFGEWGFVQLGELLPYVMDFQMDSPAAERVVRHATEFGVPVQVHVSTSNSGTHPSSHGINQLLDLLPVVERVPSANWIIAHAVGMMDDNPPVVDAYLDLVAQRFGNIPDNFWWEIRDFNSPGVRSVLARVSDDRLLAGTDWVTRVGPPFLPYGVLFGAPSAEENAYPPSVGAMVEFLRQAGASEETIENIGSLNACGLLCL